jgi:predicted transcriptional regulator
MATELSMQKAAEAWCKDSTKHIEMDVVLAEAFAEILDEIWSKPWLGNATTGEMLDEIKARVDTTYRTVDY